MSLQSLIIGVNNMFDRRITNAIDKSLDFEGSLYTIKHKKCRE